MSKKEFNLLTNNNTININGLALNIGHIRQLDILENENIPTKINTNDTLIRVTDDIVINDTITVDNPSCILISHTHNKVFIYTQES